MSQHYRPQFQWQLTTPVEETKSWILNFAVNQGGGAYWDEQRSEVTVWRPPHPFWQREDRREMLLTVRVTSNALGSDIHARSLINAWIAVAVLVWLLLVPIVAGMYDHGIGLGLWAVIAVLHALPLLVYLIERKRGASLVGQLAEHLASWRHLPAPDASVGPYR
jgi:hypothetical protein